MKQRGGTAGCAPAARFPSLERKRSGERCCGHGASPRAERSPQGRYSVAALQNVAPLVYVSYFLFFYH